MIIYRNMHTCQRVGVSAHSRPTYDYKVWPHNKYLTYLYLVKEKTVLFVPS